MRTWVTKTVWLSLAIALISSPAYALKPADEAIIELYQRVEDLQHDVNSLRGLNEQLQYELSQLRKSQKESFLDIDDRIQRTENALDKKASEPPPTSRRRDTDDRAQRTDDASEPTFRRRNTESRRPSIVDENEEPTKGKEEFSDTSSSSADRAGTPKLKDRDAYKRAYELLKDDISGAVSAFEDFLADYPSSPLASNANYWIGETWYSRGKYEKAKERFLTVLKDYKGSNKEPDAALKLGYTFVAMEEWDFAKKTLKDVVTFFPDTREADLAEKKLATIKNK